MNAIEVDGEQSFAEALKCRALLDDGNCGEARFLLLLLYTDTGEIQQHKEYAIKGRFRHLWQLAIEEVRKDYGVELAREASGATGRTETLTYVLLLIRG